MGQGDKRSLGYDVVEKDIHNTTLIRFPFHSVSSNFRMQFWAISGVSKSIRALFALRSWGLVCVRGVENKVE